MLSKTLPTSDNLIDVEVVKLWHKNTFLIVTHGKDRSRFAKQLI